jgi:hypothetical protein
LAPNGEQRGAFIMLHQPPILLGRGDLARSLKENKPCQSNTQDEHSGSVFSIFKRQNILGLASISGKQSDTVSAKHLTET